MTIDSMSLHNFRHFHEASFDFEDRLNVIVGVNGSGKSTVLDALCIAMSCYIGGFDQFAARKIAQSDIRQVTHKVGSFYENVSQPPSRIDVSGSIAGDSVSWSCLKEKDSPRSGSPSAFAAATRLAEEHQRRLREGDDSLLLPVLAYYGTGRLWKSQPSRASNDQTKTTFKRLSGYEGCMDARLSDAMLVKWFERMTYKYLQQGSVIQEFDAVRDAVAHGLQTLTGYPAVELQSNFDTHTLDVLYEDAGKPVRLPTSQLSDGYRVVLSMFADIAYRAAMLNPQLQGDVLTETEGIVLIDEIDLHLHPKWQQLVLVDLNRIFPKVQFVVTTHAPSVITSVRNGRLIAIDGENVRQSDSGFYGKDVNSILREVMRAPERPERVEWLFQKFYTFLDQGDYDEAQKVLDTLSGLLGGTDPELSSCIVRLDFERMDLA